MVPARSALEQVRTLGGDEADAAFVALADRLMLDLVDVLHVAAAVLAARVGEGAGEHDRELRAGVPVQRQPTAGRQLDEIELALRAGRKREVMLPHARREPLPLDLIEGQAVLARDRV